MKDYQSPTTTLDLTAAARTQPPLRRFHVGTFPLDALPSLTVAGRPRHLIYNLSPSTLPPGTHWISIWLGRDMKAEIMDSLGQRPLSPEVLGFIRRHSSEAIYSERPIQHWSSNACGLYCLSHGLARARGLSFRAWLDQFTSDTAANDALVQCQFMRELATPSLFSPHLRSWRREVERACQSVSVPRSAQQTGWNRRPRRLRCRKKQLPALERS